MLLLGHVFTAEMLPLGYVYGWSRFSRSCIYFGLFKKRRPVSSGWGLQPWILR